MSWVIVSIETKEALFETFNKKLVNAINKEKPSQMITLKQESVLLKKLKSLTELELVSVFEELAPHLHKNRLISAVQQALDLDDLKSEVESLEQDLEDAEDEAKSWESKCNDSREILESIKNIDDDVQVLIDKAISKLE